MTREKLFSVTIHDCEVQTFRAGGKGGQNQNKRDTGVRVIHHPSGARGEAREERSQLQNKRAAFLKMAKSSDFQAWVKFRANNINQAVDRAMEESNIKVEYGPF